GGPLKIVICDLASCASRRTLADWPTGRLRWTPDGRAIAYIDTARSNLWAQPIDGGMPRQLTHFTDHPVLDFAWSRDGRRLAVSRSTTTNDIVLFRGLKK